MAAMTETTSVAREIAIDASPETVWEFLVDRAGERLLVRLRGLREAADLADVLERGRVDLLLRRGRLEVEEHMDVPAHVAILATSA